MKEKGRKARYEGVKDAYLSYGGDEIFSAAAQSTAQCVISYGAKVTLEIAEGMYHTYVVMPFAKEAKPKANCVFDGRKTLKNGKRRGIMEIKKAEIKDLEVVVKMKMEMFAEVGSISLLQDNAEKKIYEKYKELYQDGKGCHYLVYENDNAIACGGAVIKEDVPFCFFKTPMYGYIIDVYCIPEKRRQGYSTRIMGELIKWLQNKGVHNIKLKPSSAGRYLYEKLGFGDSGEMEMWI